MKTLHVKSACCQSLVQRFGNRRRRCVACHRTWRIRAKKRGRKRTRPNLLLVESYFAKFIPSLRAYARRQRSSKDRVQVALRRSLEFYVRKHHMQWTGLIPASGELILIADAIWYRIRGVKYTIYIMLVRSVDSSLATISPPVLVCDHESLIGWETAAVSLPISIRSRIIGLVCDGGLGLVALAHHYRWLLQRCHFHLMASVQNYLSTGPRGSRPVYAQKLCALVQELLITEDMRRLQSILRELRIAQAITRSRGIHRVLGGLLRDYKDYRTYLKYPHLHLPTTSNAAESCIQSLRDLMYRCRGFRTAEALMLWLTAFICYKKTIRCRGKNQPN